MFNKYERKRSEIGKELITKLNLQNISHHIQQNKGNNSSGSEYSVLYYDYFLSNFFGYKCINVRRGEEGTFEIFEANIRKDALTVF